jgi:hypothetical protein
VSGSSFENGQLIHEPGGGAGDQCFALLTAASDGICRESLPGELGDGQRGGHSDGGAGRQATSDRNV